MTKNSVNQRFVICALVGAIGIAFYVKPLLTRFAVLDDYKKLIEVRSGIQLFGIDQGMAETLWQTGRPLPAILSGVVWFVVTDISRLSILRVLGFFALMVSLLLLIRFATRLSAPRIADVRGLIASVAAIGSLLFLPSMGATVTFATLAIPLFAIPTALLAGSLISVPSPSVPRILGVVALVLISVFTYQQMAVLSTLPVFLWSATLFVPEKPRVLPIKQIGVVLASLATGLLGNLLFVGLVSRESLERATTVSLSQKFTNLATSYIPKSLHLFLDKEIYLFATSLAIFSIISLMSIALWRPAWALLTAVLASYSISVILFVGTDGDASYRLVLPGQLILWGGLAVTFLIAMSHCSSPKNWLWIFLVTLPTALFVTTLTQAREITYDRIAAANASDFANLECLVDKNFSSLMDHEEVVLRLSPFELSGNRGVHSEVGLLASHVEWVAIDMWRVLVSSDPRFVSLQDKSVRVSEEQIVSSDSRTRTVMDLSVNCVGTQ
jgi:hypothetical protein